MTLTKYQRGDHIDGWNDCPVPLAHKEPAQHGSLQQEIDTHKTIDIIHKLFKCNIDLPERELRHYETKLVSSVEKMSNTNINFIYHICERILQYQSMGGYSDVRNELKNEVVEYMMVHKGVSTWCSPLKKIITSIN
ncbi:conserved hypothetical protein [Candida dubliniensis CD36]|uniref:Uncharacterized protein n=1 Tax=Candida dubliniensis (strain CD36 / ATCC MYA-646 / CBS 7987 / NCPF 3949 / NRRL Y-17841) TaxID=573826 RepID=B9WJX2_CANDC|nr:conserved hypothetical protein [Candida dubliniensis CD36]CAX40929.1 conserved hypothetical protein [Candida dubliniensis CD36]